MKAIIMAGGEGTRLRPLTCDMPKPMMRLMDRPIIEYSLELLALHGVTETALTLGYLPERIRDHLGDEYNGIKLSYYTESRPLGTAGGVRQAADFLTETFCVLSGDGVTDCDLTQALAFHRKSGAKVTMVLRHVSDPTEYGIVLTAPDGRITRFIEKPAWGEVVSDTVNTGVYIIEPEVLSLIPEGEYDFGSQLFPQLAQQGALFGWASDGYWCDIGDIPAYLRMCRDALDGRIALPGLMAQHTGTSTGEDEAIPEGCIISPEAHICPGARLEAPCYIGPGAYIAGGAAIGAYSMIGSGTRIDENASVKRSVIWHDSHLMDGAQVRGCVIGHSATLAPCARVYENSAVGAGVTVGPDSEVAPGVSIWPDKSVPASTLIDSNLVWGGREASCFRDGMLPLAAPGDAVRAAQACAAVMRPRELLLARSPSPIAAAVWHGCAAGLMAQGVQVLDGGVCTEPQLRYAMTLMAADCALLAVPDGIIPLDNGGVRISHKLQRSVCAVMSRQDHPRPFSMDTRPVTYSGRSEQAYTAMLASAFCADASLAPSIAVHSEDPYLLGLAEQAFCRAGLHARFEWEDELMELFPGEIGVWLSPDGLSASFSHSGGMLTAPQNELLMAWTALERGERLILTADRSTRAISEIAARHGAEVIACGGARPAIERALTEHPAQLRLNTDGIYLALCAISALTENALTLTGWLSTMPKVHRIERRVPIKNSDRGRVLRSFSEAGIDGAAIAPGGTLTMSRENAYAWLAPDDSRPECRIIAEAWDMEAARELCDICEKRLKTISEG